MKTRLATRMALTIATALAGAIVAVGIAAPASAGLPGYIKQGSYGWGDQCLGVGYYGQTNHQWRFYYCETVIPSGWSGPGLYNLWVQY